MNLKDLDPKLFRESIEKYAAEMKDRFNREVDERLKTMTDGIDSIEKWNLPGDMGAMFAKWFAKESIVFTLNIRQLDKEQGYLRHHNEGSVYLEFSGYRLELGHMKNLNDLFGCRVIMVAVPEGAEKKP